MKNPKSKSAVCESRKLETTFWTPTEAEKPENWDFRKIREDQLDAAIRYEYARSSHWIRQTFASWHRKQFQPHNKDAALGRWSGQTVGEILHQQDEMELPPEVMDWLVNVMPKEFETCGLLNVWRISSKFPDPFLSEALPGTCHMARRQYRDCPAFWEVKSGKPNPPVAWLLNSPPSYAVIDDEIHDDLSFLRQFHIVVDLRFSKTSIKEQISQWLDKMDDSKVDKIKLGKGKAASLPWFQLKELAAYRLSREAGMKYERAQAFVREHLKKHPMDKPPGVLPFYSPSAFSEAVQSVEERLRNLFPTPRRNSPKAQPH